MTGRREFPRSVKVAAIKRATVNGVQCSVHGCYNAIKARGLCDKHYAKLKTYGDPTGGRSYVGWGKRKEFIETAITYSGDECLLWPFSHNGHGYPNFSDGKRKKYAHRVVCEAVNGPAPIDRPHAAHRCGNGHVGCITPRHIRWASYVENAADKIEHGTQTCGRGIKSSKLSEDDVIKILGMKGALSCKKTGALFGVKAQTVHDIWTGRSWLWLTNVAVARRV
jgi:hypothetical protein